ncbi:hypothetical protein EDB89DRAFT_2072013 [Lactarius sanguifluus]|nr:hypothetical protein EDB89DRAFT_2072013 [Lactarius sanguifluus]
MSSPPSCNSDGDIANVLFTLPLDAQTPTQDSPSVLNAEPALQTLQVDRPHIPRSKAKPLSRQHAIYFDPSSQCAGLGVQVKFDIEGILTKLDAKHPELDFLKYEANLQELKISNLEVANMFTTCSYADQARMTEDDAELFRQQVSTEYNIAFVENEREKMRERARRIGSLIVSGSTTHPL